jgi:ketosteroid isomerase-like protein
MKKTLITLAFLSSGLVSFAQKTFTQATLNEILDEYKKDSKAFFNNRLSEDFRYTNSKGTYQPQKDFLGGTAQSIVTTEMLQPVIFQSGDLAVTSGIHQTLRTEKDGSQKMGQVAATYTWQRRNDKWMFVASQQTPVAPSTFDEATFNQMVVRWGNDPAGFVQNECDKKFIFTDGNGKSYNYDQAVETYKNAVTKINKKVENVKVWQSGNTGIATGKTIETFEFKEGKPYTYTGMFTYTFSQSNGKWVLASAQHTDYKAANTADK